MSRKSFVLLIVIVVPLLAAFWAGYGVGHRSSAVEPSSVAGEFTEASYFQSSSRDSITELLSLQRGNAITHSVAAASPAVVGINVTEIREYRVQDPFSQFFGSDPFYRQFFGERIYQQPVKSLGSGFIISPDGYIVTNDHVAGNAKEITVTLTNREKYSAELVGTDPVSDVALLKIAGKDFPYLRVGNSDDVIIGEWAIAMGNPFGLFEISDKPTVTVGVVSATGMNLSAGEGRVYRGMIQTDAAINQGNSGGPLINSAGEVIGVNSVIFTPNQGNIGLGFAIPINKVKAIVAKLKKSGKIERDFWTGLEVQTVDRRVARYFGLEKAEGVIVSDVRKNSPASKTGFKVGDIIVEVNGERIESNDNITAIVSEAQAGDVLRMKVLREKSYITLELKLERRPS
jgi:serine protease Do